MICQKLAWKDYFLYPANFLVFLSVKNVKGTCDSKGLPVFHCRFVNFVLSSPAQCSFEIYFDELLVAARGPEGIFL